MKIFFQSLAIGWDFLAHPRKTVDRLIASPRASQYAWTFLLLSVSLWTLLTGYMNLIVGATSRGREALLGISMGPDIIITLLTAPLGIGTIALASFLVTRVARWFGGETRFDHTFYTLSFTINIGSTFFDYPHEVAQVLIASGLEDPWQLHKIPGFTYWAAFIMLARIVWSLTVSVIALAHLYRYSIAKSLLAFLIGVLPIFAALIFIVM